jgi:hypothetical protein
MGSRVSVTDFHCAAFLPKLIEEEIFPTPYFYDRETTRWELLYRDTGCDVFEFHKKVDFQGATIIVVKTTAENGGYVFGGVAAAGWTGRGSYKGASPGAFLFGIRTHGSPDAAVWFPNTAHSHQATYDVESSCPRFGGDQHDLSIKGKGSKSTSNLGYTYTGNGVGPFSNPPRSDYFAGSGEFMVAEMEVFKIVRGCEPVC